MGLSRSPMVVDPRMSANSSETSTSAPPGPFFTSAPMHALHSWGFFSQGPNHGLRTKPPIPPKGA